MIYVDSIQHYPDCGLPYKDWCHMATDDGDLSELHAMASRLGLKRAWFQDKTGHPHYDLTPAKRALTIRYGAQAVDTMELARCCFCHPRLDTRSNRGVSETNPSFSPPEKGVIHMSENGTNALLTALLQHDTVKALTMTDPWGTLVALGAKRIETRSWSTPHRGPLAVHIAKTLPPEAAACCQEPLFRQTLEAGGYRWQPDARGQNSWGLPLGHIVAVVWLDTVEQIGPGFPVEEPERNFGNYRPGRFAWRFESVYRLAVTLPARGSLGLWEWQPLASFWERVQAAYDRVRREAQR